MKVCHVTSGVRYAEEARLLALHALAGLFTLACSPAGVTMPPLETAGSPDASTALTGDDSRPEAGRYGTDTANRTDVDPANRLDSARGPDVTTSPDVMSAPIDAVSPGALVDDPGRFSGWPMVSGPAGNFVTGAPGAKLVDDARTARPLWISEEKLVPPGKLRPHYNPYTIPSGGSSSLIVADGKVFASYFVPSGTVRAPDPAPDHGTPLDYLIDADDVVLAMDAATGKTAWKVAFAGKGANNAPDKRGGWGASPAYHDGRVFALGSTGRLYALDASNGKLLWESNIGPAHTAMEVMKANGLASAKMPQWPDFLVSLVVAEGTVIAPTRGGNSESIGIGGWDAATGAMLWTVPAATSGRATPALWRSGGRTYLLTGNPGGSLRLIDPKNGNVLWKVDGLGKLSFSLTPSANHVVVDVNPGIAAASPRIFGGYRISTKGAERAWILADPKYHVAKGGDASGYRRAMPHGGYFYILLFFEGGGKNRIAVVEESEGRVVYDQPAPSEIVGGWAQGLTIVDDRMFVAQDAAHREPRFFFLSLDPQAPKILGSLWTPPHKGTSGYEVPMSEPIVGGFVFLRTSEGTVRAYDFRKN